MNTHEFVKQVSESTGTGYKQTESILSDAFGIIKDAVASGDGVRIGGFGTFTAKKRNERVSFNPGKGTNVTIPAATVPKFTAAKAFREQVNI